MNITKAAVAGALAAGTALAVAACGPVVARTAPAALPSVFTPPPSAFAPDTPAPLPATSGPLGTSFTVTTTDDADNPVTYTVTLTKVDQHARLAPYQSTSLPGDHMAAARFTVTGVSGQEHDDANSAAAAIGADTTEYAPSYLAVADGPNFSYGTFTAGPGQSVSGWVSFEVPAGASLASVSWQPSFEGPSATWTLGS